MTLCNFHYLYICFSAFGNDETVKVRILKFYPWIPYKKIVDQFFVSVISHFAYLCLVENI